MTIPTQCPQCGSNVQEKSGVSQKTGKPYKFNGCTNYPTCNWIFKEPKVTTAPPSTQATELLIEIRELLKKILEK